MILEKESGVGLKLEHLRSKWLPVSEKSVSFKLRVLRRGYLFSKETRSKEFKSCLLINLSAILGPEKKKPQDTPVIALSLPLPFLGPN